MTGLFYHEPLGDAILRGVSCGGHRQMGQPQKAVPFLVDLLRTQVDEGWAVLATATRLELAQCHRAADDWPRWVRISAQLSGDRTLDIDQRAKHLEDVRTGMNGLRQSGEGLNSLCTQKVVEWSSTGILNRALPAQSLV